ncbi:threo-3-hydroxy-L-aspartate ammonia-lyase [Burkholderia sp. S171]|uniref:threo-3-hydroxy-L-aspartate ammonia-lyase n=1 Tax=Burkholderia sp. S171 TaxID=1641860 RepID=UPI00131BF89F|nr:threo-3-hydroxy-L-aspartate ammonia-lyase [Burkholderia sp. S171]
MSNPLRVDPTNEKLDLAISFNDIVRAHDRIAAHAHRTPVLTSATGDEFADATLFFKCENFQRTGAFKFRGACNAIAALTDDQRSRGVVAFSGGNHAQGIALSARVLSTTAIVVMPHDAPESKVYATRAYGGEVVLFNRHTEDREAIGRRLAEDRGLTLIPSYDHPDVMAGQGTAAKELFEHTGALDVLIVPLGGGGLLSGCAIAARAMSPACKVIGVEPVSGNDGQKSLRCGKIVRISLPNTIADGAQAQQLGRLTFRVIRHHVDDIVTVSDDDLVRAMAFFATRMKILVEPTGCLAAAAALGRHLDVKGKRVGVMVSGGNVDLQRISMLTRDKAV